MASSKDRIVYVVKPIVLKDLVSLYVSHLCNVQKSTKLAVPMHYFKRKKFEKLLNYIDRNCADCISMTNKDPYQALTHLHILKEHSNHGFTITSIGIELCNRLLFKSFYRLYLDANHANKISKDERWMNRATFRNSPLGFWTLKDLPTPRSIKALPLNKIPSNVDATDRDIKKVLKPFEKSLNSSQLHQYVRELCDPIKIPYPESFNDYLANKSQKRLG